MNVGPGRVGPRPRGGSRGRNATDAPSTVAASGGMHGAGNQHDERRGAL